MSIPIGKDCDYEAGNHAKSKTGDLALVMPDNLKIEKKKNQLIHWVILSALALLYFRRV